MGRRVQHDLPRRNVEQRAFVIPSRLNPRPDRPPWGWGWGSWQHCLHTRPRHFRCQKHRKAHFGALFGTRPGRHRPLHVSGDDRSKRASGSSACLPGTPGQCRPSSPGCQKVISKGFHSCDAAWVPFLKKNFGLFPQKI